MRLELAVNPRKVALILGLLSLYFAVQSLVAEYLIENVLDNDVYRSLVLTIDLFSVNAEQTIPTWYATLLLFGAAVLLALIAAAKRAAQDSCWRHWGGLAVVFGYLSMDEGAVIHEILADGLQNTLNLTGYLTFAWQIVAAPLVILFAVVYLRFVLHLPRHTRNLFIVAGILYVGGALVVEGISANQLYLEQELTFSYLATATIEEVCEMLGIVVLLYALLDYAVEQHYVFMFQPLHNRQGSVAVGDRSNTPANWRPCIPSRWTIFTAVIIIVLNAALVAWALTTTRPANQPPPVTAAQLQAVIDQFVPGDVLVTRLTGAFSPENVPARRVAAALLAQFNEVMVITSHSTGVSFMLAADALVFDRSTLAAALRANGESQFIIFDTLAVRAIVGNLDESEKDN